jgi:oligoribonuclease
LWCDIETTGLKPNEGQILELGLRLTDDRLNTLSEASWVVQFARQDLSNLSDFILKMHTKNGLIFECLKSGMSVAEVEMLATQWISSRLGNTEAPPMAGSTIGFDRSWLKRWMPSVDDHAHYRSFDVSTIKLACRLWSPVIPPFKGRETHRVQPDIEDSIAELNYYIGAGIVRGPGDPYGILGHLSMPDTARVGPSDA